jgi:hypothetical protein
MPASSVSGLLSTSAYFLAVMLLMALVMVPVASIYRASCEEAARTLAEGVASQIDALSPGMTIQVRFGAYPGTDVSIGLSGSTVTATVDGYSSSQTVGWPLATSHLSPGQSYALSLSGGVVSPA